MPPSLQALLENDAFLMRVLAAVRDHGPGGAYVAAGFVRNRVWDSFYPDQSRPDDADIDVVYFDDENTEKSCDLKFEALLETQLPTGIWQVRNQARMHSFGGHPPFHDLSHALSHWAETATTVGVRLLSNSRMEAIAPFGFEDLADHILRITPRMKRHDPQGFEARLSAKGWARRWPNLQVVRD